MSTNRVPSSSYPSSYNTQPTLPNPYQDPSNYTIFRPSPGPNTNITPYQPQPLIVSPPPTYTGPALRGYVPPPSNGHSLAGYIPPPTYTRPSLPGYVPPLRTGSSIGISDPSVPRTSQPSILSPNYQVPSPKVPSLPSSLQERGNRFTAPEVPRGMPHGSTAPTLPPNFSVSYYPRSSEPAPPLAWSMPPLPQSFSPPITPMNGSMPSPAFRTPDLHSFSMPSVPGSVHGESLPRSLSGRTHWVSSFQATPVPSLSGNLGATSFLSFDRQLIPSSQALATPGTYSPTHYRSSFCTTAEHLQIMQSYRREFEHIMAKIYHLNAPPELPRFSSWETGGMMPLAFRVDRNTMLFVNPAIITDMFQRATSAQCQAMQAQFTQLMKRHRIESRAEEASTGFRRNPLISALQVFARGGEADVEITRQLLVALSPTVLHTTTKYVGLAVSNSVLALMEGFHPVYEMGMPRGAGLNDIWKNTTVPAIHQKIDKLFSTNLSDQYNPRNDPPLEQLVDSFFTAPVGSLHKKVPIGQPANQIHRVESVALETRGAMQPAFAIAGSSAMAKETKAAEVIVSELKAGSRAASLESRAVSDPGKMVKTEEVIAKESAALKKSDVYAPDRPLPRDPRTMEPVPETDAYHTELGTREGTKGKYVQAREFDAQGKPVKDIDFTDHGRPQNHPNPHEHKWKPNPTGGTLQRSTEAQPLNVKD